MPALAQTPVVTLKAADEVAAAILSPRGDRIAAAVGKDRIAVWSLPDGKLLQELKFPERHARDGLCPGRPDHRRARRRSIEVRAIATGAVYAHGGGRQTVRAGRQR